MLWRPQPKQAKALKSSVFELLYGGAKGGGKSDALLMGATRYIKNPNYKALILRRTFPQLQELIDRSHKWFDKAAWNGDLHRWTFPSGAFIQFGHCKSEEDKYNYQGHEYQYLGFDQLEQFTQTQYELLTAQVRSVDPTILCFIRSTANPGGVGHTWVKQRFIDKCLPDGTPRYFKKVNDEDVEITPDDPNALSRAFVFANILDNPILLSNDPAYLARLNSLPEKLRRALKEGDWDVFEGQFFNEWRRSIHVIPSFNHLQLYNTIIGLDYGYSKPSSVGWYAVLPDGALVRYRELYIEKKTYEELIKIALARSVNPITRQPEKVEYMVADPAIWGDKKHHEEPKEGFTRGESGFDVMNKVVDGRFPILRADNRRIVGWGRMHEYLQPCSNQFGQVSARLLVTANCTNFIRTISGLVHNESNPEDVNTDGEDHPADEARYVIMSRPVLPVIPQPTTITPAEDFWGRVERDRLRFTQDKLGEEAEAEVLEQGAIGVEE